MLIVRDPESITIVGNVPNSPQFPKVCYCGKVGLKKNLKSRYDFNGLHIR